MKSASVSGVTRGRARIGKEVKETLGSTGCLHHLSYHGSRLTMVEKDTAVKMLRKIDFKGQSSLVNKERLFVCAGGRFTLTDILRASLGSRPDTQVNVVRWNFKYFGSNGEHIKQAFFCQRCVNVVRCGIFGNLQPPLGRGATLIKIYADRVVR